MYRCYNRIHTDTKRNMQKQQKCSEMGIFSYLLVAHQINQSAKFDGRFDVTIPVNGLPSVQIKLKKNGISVDEAFGHKKGVLR